jgi:hypothetical protein
MQEVAGTAVKKKRATKDHPSQQNNTDRAGLTEAN